MLESSRKFRNGLLGMTAVALIGAAGLMAAPKDANATAYAYSALQVSGMEIFVDNVGVAGGGLAGIGGFKSFNFAAQPLTVQAGGSIDVRAGSTVSGSGATTDLQQLCLPNCTNFTDNAYFGTNVPPFDTLGNFGVADSNMLNTVLNGGATFGIQAGAESTGGGLVSSGNNSFANTMNWNFTTGAGDAGKVLSLSWVEDRLTQVETSSAGESATAALQFKIDLIEKDANDVQVSSETLFLVNSVANTNPTDDPTGGPVTGVNDSATSFSTIAGTGVLSASTNYSLVFTFGSSAQALSPVPEPGALALLGVGLFGLGAIRFRKRRKAIA